MTAADAKDLGVSRFALTAARATGEREGGRVVEDRPGAAAGHRGRTDAGRALIAGACVLLAALAVSMGIVSWHAQYAFVLAAKHQPAASALEALGLDAGAVIFSILGIALARLGNRAAIERAMVCLCALGSCGMNLLGADLGSPRSVAVYVMPPLLFAAGSDRLIAVVRQSVLGVPASAQVQHSAWRLAATSALYLVRLVVAPRSTATGARRALLAATPLPELATPGAPRAIERPHNHSRRLGEGGRGRGAAGKTARFLALVQERHGPLASFDLERVGQVASELAPQVDLHAGSARTALRAAVTAARRGGRQ